MELDIEGRACVVTGASSGIGRATARLLCAEGAHVLLVARNRGRLEQAAGECAGGRSAVLAQDVTELDAGAVVLAALEEHFGSPPWALVNNAGTTYPRPIEDLDDDDWRLQWELSVMASMRLMSALAPAMADAGGGRIVNVSSSSGKRPSLRNAAYSVGKAAQLALSRAFAEAWAERQVLINAVAPGMARTPLWLAGGGMADQAAAGGGTNREQVLADLAAKIPVGRMGEEDEIAAVIAFLCSERSAFVTGSAWSVDGGTVPTII